MVDDDRCCGSGACIINDEGLCWCGQKWDGKEMRFPDLPRTTKDEAQEPTENTSRR